MVVVSQDSPAFPIGKGEKKQPVTYRQFQSVLKHMITLLGKHSDDYSAHSFRRGVQLGLFMLKYQRNLFNYMVTEKAIQIKNI